MKSPSEVLTVNVSPVRSVMTPLFLTLSPEEAPNAGATAKANTVKRHDAIAAFLLNIITLTPKDFIRLSLHDPDSQAQVISPHPLRLLAEATVATEIFWIEME